MASELAVGILGVGTYLPETVRKNDWWPEAVRAKWHEKAQSLQPARKPDGLEVTPGVEVVLKAIAETRGDPFYGAVERRVISPDMMPSEMETRAARDALARSGASVGDIDLVLGSSITPDYLASPNGCAVHRNLGLRSECLTLAIDNACNTFLQQLTLADSLIKTGRAHLALLFQSCVGSMMSPPEQPHSAWFGDGASAVLVGKVKDGHGILGHAHRTNGTLHDVLVGGVPGKRWYEEGTIYWYPRDRARAKHTLLVVADNGREVVHAALGEAGRSALDVDYYACHQATPWFGKVTQEYIGLERARHLDTFSWTGSLSSANVPFQLAAGEREGLLRAGDVVATYSGGGGITYSSIVLKWGQ